MMEEVKNHGETIFNLLVATLTIHRKKEEANVDWGFFAGRAIFRCLGDAGLARRAIMDLKSMHDRLYMESRESPHVSRKMSERSRDGIWQYNYGRYL